MEDGRAWMVNTVVVVVLVRLAAAFVNTLFRHGAEKRWRKRVVWILAIVVVFVPSEPQNYTEARNILEVAVRQNASVGRTRKLNCWAVCAAMPSTCLPKHDLP